MNVVRAQFVLQLVGRVAAEHPDYNVMVIHPKNHVWYKGDPAYRIHQHIELYCKWIGGSSFGYEVYLLRKGTEQYFRNKGDGGSINWGWAGKHCREGEWVTFY